MGWASAGDIFDPIAQALIDCGAPDEMKETVLGGLVGRLLEEDWDTARDSLDRFKDDPAIVAAFADHGVKLCGCCSRYSDYEIPEGGQRGDDCAGCDHPANEHDDD